MNSYLQKTKLKLFYRLTSIFVAITFVSSSIVPPTYAQIIPQSVLTLPAPGTMVPLSVGFTPALIKGITIHPDNPLEFDFIVNEGDTELSDELLRKEAYKMIKYFLASLTVPEEEQWVNLSPYEADRIIPQRLGETAMGRDLLAQDYLLKQLTASLIYPEDDLGQKFWNRVYSKAQEKFGTTDLPMNTFNKVWIVPEKATIYEHGNTAYVVSSHLKVMLQEDYAALEANKNNPAFGLNSPSVLGKEEVISNISSEVVREILIPEIEREINEGENFANLRQVYNSMILATWYKMNLKESLLGQVYVDQNKIVGIDLENKNVKQEIYDQYVEAFSKGVYNYIREEYDPKTQETIPRKYFSGGTAAFTPDMIVYASAASPILDGIKQSEGDSNFHLRLDEAGQGASKGDISKAVKRAEEFSIASSPIDINVDPRFWNQISDRNADVVEARLNLRKLGYFIDYAQTPEQVVASQSATVKGDNVVNKVSIKFRRTLKEDFRLRQTTGTYGVTNQVEAESLVRAKKFARDFQRAFAATVTDQHLIEMLGLSVDMDKANLLRQDLMDQGYIDDEGKITVDFITMNWRDFTLSNDYGVRPAQIYLGLIQVAYARVKSIYQGGWAEIMKYYGQSDRARAPTNYVSQEPEEISNLLLKHSAHQEQIIAEMNLSPMEEELYRASIKFVDFEIPIVMDIDHAHGQPQQMIEVNLSVGRLGLLVAAVHVEDQCIKLCGHMSDKSGVTTADYEQILTSVRQMLDTLGFYYVSIVMRTDMEGADVLNGDNDGRDLEFFEGLTNNATQKNIAELRSKYEVEMREKMKKDFDNDKITQGDIKAAVTRMLGVFDKLISVAVDRETEIMLPYRLFMDKVRADLGFKGKDEKTADILWKDLSYKVRLDKLIERILVEQGDAAQMSVEQWHAFLQEIPRTETNDYIAALKQKAKDLGIIIYTRDEWLKVLDVAPQTFEDGNVHLLWDYMATKFHQEKYEFYMIESGLPYAIAHNIHTLSRGDMTWIEQKHANPMESLMHGMAIDMAAVDILLKKDFWGLLDDKGDGFKAENREAIEAILRQYLLDRIFTTDGTFLAARQALVDLGVGVETAVQLINAVSIPKANNTSPSFRWNYAEIGYTREKLQEIIDDITKFLPSFKYVATNTDQLQEIWEKLHASFGFEALPIMEGKRKIAPEEMSRHLTIQGVTAQYQFATYRGEVEIHVLTQLKNEGISGRTPEEQKELRALILEYFEKGFIEGEMSTLAIIQRIGEIIDNYFVANSQTFAGVQYDAYLDEIGKGRASVRKAFGGDTDTQAESIGDAKAGAVSIKELTAELTKQLIEALTDFLEQVTTIQDGRGVIIAAHGELEKVRVRIRQKVEGYTDNERDIEILLNAAIDKLMSLEGSEKVAIPSTEASYDNAEIRINDPESSYINSPKNGLLREIFMLNAFKRDLAREGTAEAKKRITELVKKAQEKLAELPDDDKTSASPVISKRIQTVLDKIGISMNDVTGGTLAADEGSTNDPYKPGTAEKRLIGIGVPLDEINFEKRQDMRRIFLSDPKRLVEAGITSVIIHDEHFDYTNEDGTDMVQGLIDAGIVIIYKSDSGLTKIDGGHSVVIKEGSLEALPRKLDMAKAGGATSTKFRITIHISSTDENIESLVDGLAKSAVMTQQNEMLPVVEPEFLIDGDYSIEEAYAMRTKVNQMLFKRLEELGAYMPGISLKPSLVLSGKQAKNRASAEEVGYLTLKSDLASVPEEVRSIRYLSGGQGQTESEKNMNARTLAARDRYDEVIDELQKERAISAEKAERLRDRSVKWLNRTTVSYGRGLQGEALAEWGGDNKKMPAAREKFFETAERVIAATNGMLAASSPVELIFRQDDTLGNLAKAYPDVYTPLAVKLLKKYAHRSDELHELDERERLEDIARAERGEDIAFLPITNKDGSDYYVPKMKVSVKQARKGDYKGAAVPKEFLRPGITMTGPIARDNVTSDDSMRSIAYLLLSGAEYSLLDGEDSLGQLNTMSIDGIRNLKKAYSKDDDFMRVAEAVAAKMIKDGKKPADWNWKELLDTNYTTRIYRARGRHLDDLHLRYKRDDGTVVPINAWLVDMILYHANTYEILLDQGSQLVTFDPKTQSAEETALKAEILDDLEADLEYKGQKLNEIVQEDGQTGGILKTIVLIENVKADMQAAEIRAAYGRHIIMMNMARWDYIATVIKAKDHDPNWVPDDFTVISMLYPFMAKAEKNLWRVAMTPDKNGNTIIAEGGMEVQIPTIPDKIDPDLKAEYIKGFVAKALAGKQREAMAGYTRAWVAHWDMVDIVAAAFKAVYTGKNAHSVIGMTETPSGDAWELPTYTDADAAAFFALAKERQMTVEGLRRDINEDIQYKNNVLYGFGAAAIKRSQDFGDPSIPFLMSDRAIDEGQTAGTRKKLRVNAKFTADDPDSGVKKGDRLTEELFDRLLAEEFAALKAADDRFVFDASKETTLEISRIALERFVKAPANNPWSVDYEVVVLGITDPVEAEQRMIEYDEELTRTGGVKRITTNARFVAAVSSPVVDQILETIRGHRGDLSAGNLSDIFMATADLAEFNVHVVDSEYGEMSVGNVLKGLWGTQIHKLDDGQVLTGEEAFNLNLGPAPALHELEITGEDGTTMYVLDTGFLVSSPLLEQRATSEEFIRGGIDLNSALLDLQIKRDGNGVPLPVFNQPMDLLMNIQGFLPVIINVTPVNVPLLLGLAETPDADSDFGFIRDLDPSDRKARFEFETVEEISMVN